MLDLYFMVQVMRQPLQAKATFWLCRTRRFAGITTPSRICVDCG